MNRRRRHRLKLKSFYVWHRWLGLAAALFVILLAVTGLMLNHTEALRLDARHVHSDWLLDHYGIHAPAEVPAHAAGEHWISQWGRRLYLDTRDLGETADGRLIGAGRFGELILIALERALLLVTPEGDVVERLGAESLPALPLQGLGRSPDGRPQLHTPRGSFVADGELLGWQRIGRSAIQRAPAGELPPALRERLLRTWRGQGLSLERVILDLHSGRILGAAGVFVMDAAAVLLLLLAFSGSGIWIVRTLRERQRNRQRTRHDAAEKVERR